MQKSVFGICAAGGLLVFGVFLGAGSLLADGDQEVKKRVKVKRIHMDCEGEDCEEGEHIVRKVFVNKDGEVTELSGDEANEWVSEDGSHVMIRHMGEGMHGMEGLHGLYGKGGFLGVGLTELTPQLREHFGASAEAGIMVGSVVDDSPAARAGVQVGDIIAAVDGQDVGSGGALGRMIRKHEAGDTVVLNVLRAGKAETLSATLEEREGPSMMAMAEMHGGGKVHVMHGDGAQVRQIRVRCQSEGEGAEDCQVEVGDEIGDFSDFDCGSDNCEVRVECEDDGCECTVNGEARDCDEIPGFAERHGN